MRLLLLLSLAACSSTSADSADSAVEAGCQTLVADPILLRWEGIEPGGTATGTFTVTNQCTSGEDALVFTAASTDPAFTVDLTAETTLAPGEGAVLTVTFTAIDNASHYGTITLSSNDAVSPEVYVSLEGVVTTDADADGFANLGAGGDDCDDANAAVHPGANEVWYDGVDQDCDGGSDYDQDGDGWPALAYGGNDCNDTDEDVHPGADEVLDEADQDCDDMVDEDFVLAKEILVVEVMADPSGVTDEAGEWFEVYNTGTARIDLYGWTVTNGFGDSFTVDRHVEIAGGGRALLGSNLDTKLNGGVSVNAAWDPATFSLGSSDQLTLKVDARLISSISWAGAPAGLARQLDPDHENGTDGANSEWWCDASTDYASGDSGTPGDPNDQCTTVDEDGDGLSEAAGDCDDADATVNPDAVDAWNGDDDDCDGYADNPDVGDVATAEITGSTSAYLTAPWGLGSGDYTGDGQDDLVIGAAYSASYSGTAWLIDGGDVIGASGDVASLDTATLNGERYSYAGIVSPSGEDYTGDGTDDLVVQGAPYAMYGGYAATFYEGGSSLSGIMDSDDAYATLDSGSEYGYGTIRSLSHLDFDGDGIGELVRADAYYGAGGGSFYTGRVEIYDVYGSTGELSDDDAVGLLSGTDNNGQVGTSVAGGDLDGDGHDELVIGAPGVAGAATGGGVVYIVNGDDVDQEADLEDVGSLIYGATSNAFVGRGGLAVGDLDASGGLDLVIGAPGADEVYVFFDANGLPDEAETTDADTVITGSGSFGFVVALQDSDHDGRNDLVVGAPAISSTYLASYAWFMGGGTDIGQVHMFDRSVLTAGGSQPSTLAFRGLSATASGDLFGSVLASGDWDDDGIDDLAVGAPATNGRAYVVLGN